MLWRTVVTLSPRADPDPDPNPNPNQVNATLWRTVVTGPEDPKLVLFPSRLPSTQTRTLAQTLALSLALTLAPIRALTLALTLTVALLSSSFAAAGEDPDGQGVVRLVFGSMPPKEDVCAARPKYQMFQTSTALEAVEGENLGYRAQAVKSECGVDEEHEKNWISFADGDALRYVKAVSDHWVVTQAANGECQYNEEYISGMETNAPAGTPMEVSPNPGANPNPIPNPNPSPNPRARRWRPL